MTCEIPSALFASLYRRTCNQIFFFHFPTLLDIFFVFVVVVVVYICICATPNL